MKRFTTPKARSMAFGLFYTVMNVAALLNGFAVDALRKWLCHGITIPGVITLNDGNRVVVASGAVSAAIAFVVTLYLSPAVEEEALVHVGGVGSGGLYGDDLGETLGLVTAEPSSQHPAGLHGRYPECDPLLSPVCVWMIIGQVHVACPPVLQFKNKFSV